MALYTYKCEDCNIHVDKIRGINDPEPVYECENCKSVLFRVYQSPGVVFNGSGFYSTDK